MKKITAVIRSLDLEKAEKSLKDIGVKGVYKDTGWRKEKRIGQRGLQSLKDLNDILDSNKTRR